MKKYLVDMYSWERPAVCSGADDFQVKDSVVIETEFGNDLGVIHGEAKSGDEALWNIVRGATERDKETFQKNEEKKEDILKTCRQEIKRLNVAMKLIDVRISLDGSNLIVAFTADGRVDFRELVKSLSKILRRSIRMQQIGSREEARRLSGCGICGRELCCVKFSGNLPSISTEMARAQQVAHRGSERISGLCGRLMCCLAYEAQQYRDLLAGMPELHSQIRSKQGKGQVVEINALKQEIRIRLENNEFVTIKKEDLL